MRSVKILPAHWPSLRSLFWTGPVLLVMGLSAGFVSGTWGPIVLGLLTPGMFICSLWLWFQVTGQRFWSQRSTQVGGNALVATLAVLVILGLVNFLGVRYDTRIDLTEKQLFTLSPQSQQVVKELKQPVKVWVFSGQLTSPDRSLLENFHRQNPTQFSFEVVDPQAQPALVQKFDVKEFGDVFLESGKRRQFLQSVRENRLSESKLVNALAQLNNGRQTQVYFLQGHGEHSLESGQGAFSAAVKALEAKSILSKPLNLAVTGKVPGDASVVVVAGPQQTLLEGEAKALEAYLKQGGNLLLLIDPNTNPGLETLLKSWGVTLDNAIAIDASGRGQLVGLNPAAPLVTHYGDSPITRDFGNNTSFYPLARPLEITPVDGVKSTPLLLTNEQSWAETDLQSQDLKFDANADRRGPLILGVALSRPATSSSSPSPAAKPGATPSPQKPESRLVVIGNSQFAMDGLFDRVLNGDVFLNSVTWLGQQHDSILSIRPKEDANRRLTITTEQGRLLSLLALGVLPLLAFGTATFLWWQRR
ncbi:hypothetical protein DO97_03780 [Neosynechococcus sphagnicola sy1]|uniref:Uncharacterized protein n=1 Tax=Neosynechococcus sphagnicola sy1 TaxID=1497020 RepID=A0A098TPU8_9CYAN|nr:hypothetical protein DO97_03780 [Neosynechococcus sphagnicola sy1]